MSRVFAVLLAVALLGACGGGGGGGSTGSEPAPEPPPSNPGPTPTAISITDALPSTNTVNFDPGFTTLNFSHPSHSDLDMNVSGCDNMTVQTVRRTLLDLADTSFDELSQHRIRCGLAENTAYNLLMEGTRENDAAFEAEHSFSTGTAAQPGIMVQDQATFHRSLVDDLFVGYIAGALLDDLDLPGGVESLILGTLVELSEANWDNLVNPDALYSVVNESVTYLSRDPAGAPDNRLSGLVSRPQVTGSFTPRESIIVLAHATGSTPGDLNLADAWFILANQFASRGYLVIAPDNYGRGNTSADPETYLLANRTASNALDLIQQVLDEPAYGELYSGRDVTIVGYSQGGHSALGLWLMLETQGNGDLSVNAVYAGGAPHNLYQTFRGVLRHLDGSCNGNGYCRYVDEDTTVPFATDRILPGLLAYTETGLSLDDLVSGETINAGFVSGFLQAEQQYDALKTLLQLNSFAGITSVQPNLGTSTARLHLYHSDYDRLVPQPNTGELVTMLSPHVDVDHHDNRCNGDGYETIFNLTDKVGVIHTLCGLSVLDDAMEQLK